MAMIDSSIYFQQKSADPFGSYAEGMKMGDMIKQRKDQENIKQAYKAGMVQNPDGTYKQDLGMTMSALAKGGYAQEYSSLAQQQKEQQAAQAKMQREQQAYNATEVGRLAGSALQNPNAWMQIRTEAIKKGYGTEESLPQAYDEKFLRGIQSQALTVAEQAAQQNKDREFSLKEKELDLKKREDAAKKQNGSGEGWKKVNQDYAKDYNDFTGGGMTKATDSIQKLKDYKTRLESESKNFFAAGGGPISGSLPDAFRTQESISLRDNIRSVANSALKATFGGALSDGERIALANEFYNDKLDAKQNLEIVDRKIKELENGLATQRQRAKYFEQNKGNLAGFQSGLPEGYKTPGPANEGQTLAQNKPSWAK